MTANTPVVNKYAPILRNGVATAGLIQSAQWVDNLVLVAGAAKSYTRPAGTNPAGGAVTSSGPAGSIVHATILRITATGGPVWVDTNGNTAAVPVADNTSGNGPVCIPAGLPYFMALPLSTQNLSFIADAPVALSIEAWW